MKQIIKIISFGTALLAAGILQAQTNLSNTGTLSVSPGGILYITGSFNNSASATLINRGSLHIRQDLTNAQAIMAANDGTLYLSGTTLQTVNGAQPFSTFNLVTGNTAGILLNNDLHVYGLHTFNAGIVTTATTPTPHYLIYEAGASYTGSADTRHINGWVRKSGNSAFIFPVGNGLVERSLLLKNLSASSVFDVRFARFTPNTSSITPPLVTIDLNEYWVVNKVSGGTAIVDMNWDNSKVAMPPYVLSDIRVAGIVGGAWVALGGGATGNVATTGTISSNTLSSFGTITFGSTGFALPVTILQFSARAASGGNIINWTTIDAINVSYFDLQRSDDGANFYSIANVTAQNGATAQQYQFTDSKPVLQPVVYYRLRSVDRDGQAKTSKVVSVSANGNNPALLYAISPAHGRINLQVQGITGALRYRINTLVGQTVQLGVLNTDLPGRYSIQLLPSITKGIYILQVEKTGFTYTQRILVE